VRTLIDEIIVRVEDNALDLVIRWHGGDHSALKVRKNSTGQHPGARRARFASGFLRSPSGRLRKSSPSISRRSKAYSMASLTVPRRRNGHAARDPDHLGSTCPLPANKVRNE
jgi:hypothetical protein